MSKKGRHRKGGRTTPKGTRPLNSRPTYRDAPADRHDDGPDSDLMASVRRALADADPLPLLGLASSLVAALDPRQRSPFDRDAEPSLSRPELIDAFIGVEIPETSALLAAIAPLDADELERRRILRCVDERGHPLPEWLAGLNKAEAYRTMEMTDVLGDGDSIFVAVRLTTGEALTAVVYIDHNLGTVVKDAFVLSHDVDQVLGYMRDKAPYPDASFADIPAADARVRINDAIATGAMTFPPYETDTWPACRPLVEWMVRLLPAGGRGYERPDWSDDEQEDLARRFFESAFAAGVDDEDYRSLLGQILWFGTGYGPGDPMRWSPVAVELLLADWIPRKLVEPVEYLTKAPELLRRFIRFCHVERAIPSRLTDDTLEAVDRWEPDYQSTIRSPRLQGAEALLAAVGAFGPDGDWDDDDYDDDDYDDVDYDDDDFDDGSWDYESIILDLYKEAVGGVEALALLDDAPLPDEPFDWRGIPDDLRDRVSEILTLCDRCCDELLDTECRTAARRVLARIARRGDKALRRGRVDTAAAAVCWSIGQANRLFSASAGGLTQKRLLAEFGNEHASVSQRAMTLLVAAGFAPRRGNFGLGSPDYLVSAYRHRIIEFRDRSLMG